jgi:hypothetical protein
VRGISAVIWLVALAFGAVACGEPETESEFSATPTDEGVVYTSHWVYRDFDVDVDLWLVTEHRGAECTTTGRLRVNDVISSADDYDLDPTDCSVLELTEQSDIVMFDRPTGHRWSDETLDVDTDAEAISLGPATVTDEAGETRTYRFVLSAPECPDDDDCDCAALVRFDGGARLELPLGRTCD